VVSGIRNNARGCRNLATGRDGKRKPNQKSLRLKGHEKKTENWGHGHLYVRGTGLRNFLPGNSGFSPTHPGGPATEITGREWGDKDQSISVTKARSPRRQKMGPSPKHVLTPRGGGIIGRPHTPPPPQGGGSCKESIGGMPFTAHRLCVGCLR